MLNAYALLTLCFRLNRLSSVAHFGSTPTNPRRGGCQTDATGGRTTCDSTPAAQHGVTFEAGATACDPLSVAALMEEFVRDVPSMQPLSFDDTRLRKALLSWSVALLRDNARYSVFARQGQRCVGALINGPIRWPYDGRNVGGLYEHYPLDGLKRHAEFMRQVLQRADPCSRYDTPSAFELGIGVMARDFRRSGVAERVLAESLHLAARLGYRAAVAVSTSSFSGRLYEHLGFERLAVVSYDEHPMAALYRAENKSVHPLIVCYGQRLPPFAGEVVPDSDMVNIV